MTKSKKFLIRQTDGAQRATVKLTKAGSRIWKAGDPDDQKEIRNTIADAAKKTLGLDKVVVVEVPDS